MNLLLLLLSLFGGCGSYPAYPVDTPFVISQEFHHFKTHVGVDISLAVGSNVYTVQDGIVIWAGNYGSTYGNSVIVLHCDGYLSLYAHLSGFEVLFGEVVEAGQLIGYSGGLPGAEGAGASTGAHLHYEIRPPGFLHTNTHNIDPLEYLEVAAPVCTVHGRE